MILNKVLSPISFTYLIIQPFATIDAEKATVGSWKKYIFIPIPLSGATLTGNEGAFSAVNNTGSNLLGFNQVTYAKSLNIFTQSGLDIINKNAFSTSSSEISLTSADFKKGITFQAQGQEQFSLNLMSDSHNLSEPALDAYMEVASNTLTNVIFHYISNKTFLFNMILQSYLKVPNSMNSIITLNFFKPPKGQQIVDSDTPENSNNSITTITTSTTIDTVIF